MNIQDYKKIKIKDFTDKHGRTLWNKIRQHANGSLYRLNAQTANCYTFEIDKAGTVFLDGTISDGKSWSGGWDWSDYKLVDPLEYLVKIDGGLYQLK